MIRRDEPTIRHSFDQTAGRLARLSLFAEVGESRDFSYEVTIRQAQLATDDVLNIAIACRRLIDSLSLRATSFERKVLAHSAKIEWRSAAPRPSDLSLHETLNRIIHSSIVEVYNFSYQLISSSSVEAAYDAVLRREEYRIPPMLAVKSDRDSLIFCDMKDLCLAVDEILQAAIDTAGEIGINLGED